MTFYVGQKVVCIDASNFKKSFEMCPNRPVRGFVYTVREILDGAILLEEIVNPPDVVWKNGEYGEAAFVNRRFRPVAERKTDISIFIQMLKPSKVEA